MEIKDNEEYKKKNNEKMCNGCLVWCIAIACDTINAELGSFFQPNRGSDKFRSGQKKNG